MKSEVFLMDCMEGMKQYPDNYFDLAVVDPPYGLGIDGQKEQLNNKMVLHLKPKASKSYCSSSCRCYSIWL